MNTDSYKYDEQQSATNVVNMAEFNQNKEDRRKYYIPQDNSDIGEEKESENEINPKFMFSQRIFDLTNDSYILKESFDIYLEIYQDEVIAVMTELEISVSGEDNDQAISKLKKEIIYLYDHYNDMPDKKLGKLPRSWKRILKKLIEKI